MGMCRRCGGRAEVMDHVVPLADGGTNDDRNLQSLCRACSVVKTSREQRDRAQGARRSYNYNRGGG